MMLNLPTRVIALAGISTFVAVVGKRSPAYHLRDCHYNLHSRRPWTFSPSPISTCLSSFVPVWKRSPSTTSLPSPAISARISWRMITHRLHQDCRYIHHLHHDNFQYQQLHSCHRAPNDTLLRSSTMLFHDVLSNHEYENNSPEVALERKELQDDHCEQLAGSLYQITFLNWNTPASLATDHETNSSVKSESDNEANGMVMDARCLSEFLMDIGACSVSITDADVNTDREEPWFHEPTLASQSYLDDSTINEDVREQQQSKLYGDSNMKQQLHKSHRLSPIWKRCHVKAHFPSSRWDISSLMDLIRTSFDLDSNPVYTLETVPNMDWISHVQQSWKPIVTKDSKFVLRFPWHDDGEVMKACQEREKEVMMEEMMKQSRSAIMREGVVVHINEYDEEGEDKSEDLLEKGAFLFDNRMKHTQMKRQRDYVQIYLEGGIAFGTGEHPTTQLCLGWVRDSIEKYFQRKELLLDKGEHVENLQFIDYGSGSGVLGIAAARVVIDYENRIKWNLQQHQLQKFKSKSAFNESATVVGVEIDAEAIHIANENSKKNNVDMKNYLPTVESLDDEALSVVLKDVNRKQNRGIIHFLPQELNASVYDLCVANILAGPLVRLAPTIANLVKSPGGEIGLSGVLSAQAESVVQAYETYFEDVRVAAEVDGWVLITGRRI